MSFKSSFLVLCLALCTMEACGFKNYVAYQQNVHFFIATQACRQKGGHLASVESADENARVEAAIKAVVGDKASYWWIGGMDYGAEGRFVWYPLNKVVDYKNFVPGEPNNSYGAEDCLAVDSTKQYKWNDVGCNAQVEGYVCAFIR